ncbi:hypothetical protein PNEG_01049 [Pneumocystis murina B123]|uniref:RGS domain-containing protein n=1 Tax=Pneumocystis murina (strain B123) TaxID=1069680 RepID=M7NQB2_PNEMU|nr:hypothetical protein PNEG_01049 [Pneumocystis murina B123]EMR10903.1 hypothetical protein PNEG_01049 [Pneumocystis murina B123]
MSFKDSRDRLPTLHEVLSRRAEPPVDLFNFYIYMRDQAQSVDYLDLWLDIMQHTSLCRLYVRELRKSILVSTPEKFDKEAKEKLKNFKDGEEGDYLRSTMYSEKDIDVHIVTSNLHNFGPLGSELNNNRTSGNKGRKRESYLSSEESRNSSEVTQTINRKDIRASAERVLYAYLIQGAEREVALPSHILRGIATAIEADGRDDPEVFDEARDYVFQAMERDAYPGFLRAKALGNIIPLSSLLRLLIGLLSLFAGLWTGFTLIFLGATKSERSWIFLPFLIGIYCIYAHQYFLDPILVIIGLSETTFLSYMRIREPYVKKLLLKRALWVLLLIGITVITISLLMSLVPTYRL